MSRIVRATCPQIHRARFVVRGVPVAEMAECAVTRILDSEVNVDGCRHLDLR